jgi:hypothetical protein
MLEFVGANLIPGQNYLILNPDKTIIKGTFLRFTQCPFVALVYTHEFSFMSINLFTFYRFVSPQEYKVKLKEKYDATVLNIVLKRLIDPSFTWEN